ncbi:MAG: LysR family transcriptional regulator [Sulfobacillus sp.]
MDSEGFLTNLHPLRVFLVVARLMSFSRAAEELHISQSAVSMHVKNLEQRAGVPLFEKRGRHMMLTDAGQTLVDYGQRIFSVLEETEQVMTALKGGRYGKLRVAADTTAGVYIVPAYLGIFRQKFPDLAISLDVVNRSQVVERLRLRQADLAVMGQVPDPPWEWDAVPFLDNELVVIANPGHEWRTRDAIRLDELANTPLLVREPGSGTRKALERLLAQRGLGLQIAMELGSNSTIKQAVIHGLGLTVISRRVIELELSTGRLVVLNVEGFPIRRSWYVVHLDKGYLVPPAQAFKQLLLTGASQLEHGAGVAKPPPPPQ